MIKQLYVLYGIVFVRTSFQVLVVAIVFRNSSDAGIPITSCNSSRSSIRASEC